MQEIKDRIKEIRLHNNLSQEEFGNRIKIKRSAVSKLESGLNSPSEQTITLICSEFNVNENWVKYGTGPIFKPDEDDFTKVVVAIDRGDPKARETILNYWKLSQEDKELVWKFFDRFMK